MEKVAKDIIKAGEKHGNVEVVITKTKEISLTYTNNYIENTTEGNTTSLAIRVSKDKTFGYSTTMNIGKWKECLINAIKLMRISKPLENKIEIQKPQQYLKPIGVFSKRVEDLKYDYLFESGKKLIDFTKKYDKRIKVPSTSIEKDIGSTIFNNSNDVYVKEKQTLLSASVQTSIDEVTGFDFHTSHDIFKIKNIAEEAAKICVDGLNPKPIKTSKYDLILDYLAISSLISAILIPSLCADNVQAKRSFLQGKLGKKVFSEKLNVIDDGTLPHGLYTNTSDAEGTPQQKTMLIEDGTPKNYLYDSYSARKDKKESTGNCTNLAKVPSVGATNFIIKPGDYTEEEIISETKQGIITKYLMGTHTVNAITGDVSVALENAFYIKNGKIQFPIKQAMISLNLFDALKNLEVIGNKLRQENNVSCPTVKFKDIQVIS